MVRETTYAEKVDEALSYDELEALKPSTEEMFRNTRRSTVWYNEAVWTAAALFVEAAEQNELFRRAFLTEAQVKKPAFPNDEDAPSVEVDAWRDTLSKECPEIHEQVMSIGLSAFQGGNAEQVARKVVTEDLSSNHPNN